MQSAERGVVLKLLVETNPFRLREDRITDFQRLDELASNSDKHEDIAVPCLALRNVLLDYMDLWRTVMTDYCPEMGGD